MTRNGRARPVSLRRSNRSIARSPRLPRSGPIWRPSVTAIDAIKKWQSQAGRPEAEQSLDRALTATALLKPAATAVPRVSWPNVRISAAVAILFAVLSVAIWSVRSLLTNDVVSGEVGMVSSTPNSIPPQSPVPTPDLLTPHSQQDRPGFGQVDSSPEPTATPPSRPAVYVGAFSIDASPQGQVFIDRKPAGRTPLRAPERLRAGRTSCGSSATVTSGGPAW